jgi:hypothetical protein
MVESEDDITAKNIRGQSADGRVFSVIPIRYNHPLSDPKLISKDLIGIVGEYYEAALNYKYKDEIKDKIESLIDILENREFTKNTTSGTKTVSGKDTNTYMSARKAADMFLYGMLTDQMRTNSREWSKVTTLAKKATTAINLGLNPAVAATGFFSTGFAHIINAITGDQNYGIKEFSKAIGINAVDAVVSWLGIKEAGTNSTDNKTMAFMEMFNLVNQLDRKYKKSHQNRFYKLFSNNYTFGLLTAADFMIKSNIMTTILLSHRLVDGKFVSKEDLFVERKKMSDDESKLLL